MLIMEKVIQILKLIMLYMWPIMLKGSYHWKKKKIFNKILSSKDEIKLYIYITHCPLPNVDIFEIKEFNKFKEQLCTF